MADSKEPDGAPPKGKKHNPPPPIVLHVANKAKGDLIVHAPDLTVTARALAKMLAEQCQNLFTHDRKPVLVVPADQDGGAPTMQPVTSNEVIIAAHKVCQPVKRSGERREVTLPKQVADLYLAMPEEWRLRPLASFASAPMLRDDGSIHCESGYDTATGVYIYNVPKITVPDQPSREDANRALATLRFPFRTFAFADRETVEETFQINGKAINVPVTRLDEKPGQAESAFLAALLTAVCRPSLPIAPAIAVRSVSLSGSGVGKKLLVQGVSCVAFGQKVASVALGSGKEFEKGLVAAVIRPDPCTVIDNVNGRKLESETLCTTLSDRPAMVRMLGVSELKEANLRALIWILGNAFTFAEDLVRRNFVVEMDARVENPELRKFAGNFLADIIRRRTQLLEAALTVWRFGRQQVKFNSPPLGGYEEWTEWVRDPLVALGCKDPVSATRIAKAKTADPKRLATVEVFQSWWQHHHDDGITANELDETVKALLVPDPNKRNRQNIAACVARLDGTRLAGFHLTSNKDDETKGRWSPVTYRLEQLESESEPAPEPEATGDDADDWQFNREPINPTPEEALDILNEPEQEPEPPRPTDPVERWRAGFARLDPRRDPCAGFRTDEWPRVHKVIHAFLAGPFAKLAADAGWTDRELFGVHPVVGVARIDCCGVLMSNARGAPVTHVTPQFFRFGNLTGRKDRLNLNGSVEVWNFERTPAGTADETQREI